MGSAQPPPATETPTEAVTLPGVAVWASPEVVVVLDAEPRIPTITGISLAGEELWTHTLDIDRVGIHAAWEAGDHLAARGVRLGDDADPGSADIALLDPSTGEIAAAEVDGEPTGGHPSVLDELQRHTADWKTAAGEVEQDPANAGAIMERGLPFTP